MANPSKRKGTEYENEIVDELRGIWPACDRAKTNNPSCDIVGTTFIDAVECKHRKVWSIPDWIRKIRRHGAHWIIFVGDGDRRRADSVGDVMVVPRHLGVEMLAAYVDVMNGDLVLASEVD